MSDNTRDVTGGDLHKLWKVTHLALPEVENVYIEMTKKQSNVLASGDNGTYGRAFSAWQECQQVTHDMLYRTASSLRASRSALDEAIKQYAHVDGDNSNELTEAGEQLESNLKDPSITKPDEIVEVNGAPVEREKGDE